MRKYMVWVAALFATLFIVAPGVRADANDFEFKLFSGDYYLSRDHDKVSELRVKEKLVAQFPNIDQNHGIERAIPETYKGHGLELRIAAVTDEYGNPRPYTTRSDNGYLILRIGDANRFVYGEQSYVIEYTMRGVVADSTGNQEFYWDINGDQWKQVFGAVEARVHVPHDMAQQVQDRKICYTGSRGSTGKDCVISYRGEADASTTVLFASARPLQPGESLTVALGFPAGTFAPYKPSAWQLGEWAKIAVSLAVPPAAAFIAMLVVWRRKGRDAPAKTTVVPQYLPPQQVSVLGANAVLKETFEPKAISATIIDLAVRHYIKIYETKPEKLFKQAAYELELVKNADGLKNEERAVISMLFPGQKPGTRVKLEDLKAKLVDKSAKIGEAVTADVTRQGYFVVSPSKARLPYFVAAGLLFALGFVPFIFEAYFLGFGIMAAAFVVCMFAFAMPARTVRGAELRAYLLGVREYIKLAEAERLKVLQSPHGSLTQKIDTGDNKQLVKLYEKLLPYAMLFGLEKDWAKQMAGLYEQAPDWYSGTSTFNAAWFAGSVGGFTSHAQNAFAPASDSSGSGFSGGAGGGGGGGGGGGW